MDLLDLYRETQSQEFFLFYPTGSGKTMKACEFARFTLSKGVKFVIVIVPNARHVDGWQREMERYLGKNDYLITTMNAFYRSSELIYSHHKPTLFVIDEIHNIIPKTFLTRFNRSDSSDAADGEIRKRTLFCNDDDSNGTEESYDDPYDTPSLSTDYNALMSRTNIDKYYHRNQKSRDYNETANKLVYFLFLKKIFSRNHSRVILGLSATPFSNKVKLEVNAYRELVRLDLPNYREISVPGHLKVDDLVRDSLTCFGDTATLYNLYFFANRCVFPTESTFEKYPSSIYFATNEPAYLEGTREDDVFVPDHHIDQYLDIDPVVYVRSNIMNITLNNIRVPLYLINSLDQATDHLCQNILRVESLFQYLPSGTPKKQLVVTYHLKLRSTLADTLRSTFKRYRIVELTRSDDATQLLDSLEQFNSSKTNVILVTTLFMSEGLGLKNVMGAHIFEPFHSYTTPDTIQILGRSCRYASHSSFMADSQPDGKAKVYTFLYADKYNLQPIREALQKESAIRKFLVDIKRLQTEIFAGTSISADARKSLDDYIADEYSSEDDDIAEDTQHTSHAAAHDNSIDDATKNQTQLLNYNIRQISVSSISKLLDVAIFDRQKYQNVRDQEAENNNESKDTSCLWLNTSLLCYGKELLDTSEVRCRTILFRRNTTFKPVYFARFLIQKRIPPNATVISGKPPSDLFRHIIEAKDIEAASEILKKPKTKTRMRHKTLKGASLKTFSIKALEDLCACFPNNEEDQELLDLIRRYPTAQPNLKDFIYHKSLKENRYFDRDSENILYKNSPAPGLNHPLDLCRHNPFDSAETKKVQRTNEEIQRIRLLWDRLSVIRIDKPYIDAEPDQTSHADDDYENDSDSSNTVDSEPVYDSEP